jgi:Protein of unknown function (DUF4239)
MVTGWMVSNVPPLLLFVGLVVLIVGGAVLTQKFVRRRFPTLTEDTHNDATKFAYGVIGFVYAFTIGFCVSTMWSQINSEDAQSRIEGAAGVQLAKDLTVFDKADGDRIRQALLEYERAAVVEWPRAAKGVEYPEADRTLQRLYAAYEQIQPRNDTQKTFLATSFSNLGKLSQARTARILQAHTDRGPPWSLWSVILLTSGLVLGSTIIYGVREPRMHFAMVATVGTLVAANLFLVMELAHPFVGEMATSPEPLRYVIEVLSTSQT